MAAGDDLAARADAESALSRPIARLMAVAEDYPEMNVMEVEDAVMIKTCEMHGYNYTVITSDDIVIPPIIGHDII